MNAQLPDVSVSQRPCNLSPLNWVGMQHIDLPTVIDTTNQTVNTKVDVYVNLPKSSVKGIHMSRLYHLINHLSVLNTISIKSVLKQMIDSHQDCGTTAAKIVFKFDLLLKRDAIVSTALSGWKSYPVIIEASIINELFNIKYTLDISYSSTCPCSAALSRQIIKNGFKADFSSQNLIPSADIEAWLEQYATLATPHSQRSIATVLVQPLDHAHDINFVDLINSIENTLKTPTQTAVKRADEQAFAKLNGENLMFVEDAARRLKMLLDQKYKFWSAQVVHQESLHPHDAIAFVISS